jgi:hypothetical protein
MLKAESKAVKTKIKSFDRWFEKQGGSKTESSDRSTKKKRTSAKKV